MEDGCGEEESQAALRGVEIDVFAFGGGDAGHFLDGEEPVSLVVVLEVGSYFSHELEVVVVEFDVGLAGISDKVLVSIHLVLEARGKRQGTYGFDAGGHVLV